MIGKKMLMSLPIERFEVVSNVGDLTKARVKVYHLGANPNGTFFERSCIENSRDSFNYKPIVCDFNSNETDFKGHEDTEKPIGCIPERCNYKTETIDNITWVSVDCYLYSVYCADAIDIIKDNDSEKYISMEIMVEDGFDGNDGYFHVTKFSLLGVTILGNNYTPAMGYDAKIQLYESVVKNEEFELKFTSMVNKIDEIIKNNKGGQQVNRDEIIAKYTKYSTVEGYSEIVDNAELSDEELEKALFELSYKQKLSSINEALGEFTTELNWYGESFEIQKYWYTDITNENVIIVEDIEDDKTYGINFEMQGDKAVLDMESITRYVKGDWRPYSDGSEEDFACKKKKYELMEEAHNKAVEKAQTEIKENFDVKETEEYKAVDGELSTLKADYVTLKTEKEELETEIEPLRQFKLDKDLEEKEAQYSEVLGNYTALAEIEAYKELVEKKFEYSLEELEKECKVIAFDNNITLKKTYSTKKKETQTYPLDNLNAPKQDITEMDRIISKYRK